MPLINHLWPGTDKQSTDLSSISEVRLMLLFNIRSINPIVTAHRQGRFGIRICNWLSGNKMGRNVNKQRLTSRSAPSSLQLKHALPNALYFSRQFQLQCWVYYRMSNVSVTTAKLQQAPTMSSDIIMYKIVFIATNSSLNNEYLRLMTLNGSKTADLCSRLISIGISYVSKRLEI